MSHLQMMLETNRSIITKVHLLGMSQDIVKKGKLRRELEALEKLFGLNHCSSLTAEFKAPSENAVLDQKINIITYIPLKPKPIQFIIPVLLKFYEDMAQLYHYATNVPEDSKSIVLALNLKQLANKFIVSLQN